jgi:hypothetical protein
MHMDFVQSQIAGGQIQIMLVANKRSGGNGTRTPQLGHCFDTFRGGYPDNETAMSETAPPLEADKQDPKRRSPRL